MREEIKELINKTKRSLNVAQKLYQDEEYDFSVSEASKIRNIGDYSFTEEISKEECEKILKDAEKFSIETEKFLTL